MEGSEDVEKMNEQKCSLLTMLIGVKQNILFCGSTRAKILNLLFLWQLNVVSKNSNKSKTKSKQS